MKRSASLYARAQCIDRENTIFAYIRHKSSLVCVMPSFLQCRKLSVHNLYEYRRYHSSYSERGKSFSTLNKDSNVNWKSDKELFTDNYTENERHNVMCTDNESQNDNFSENQYKTNDKSEKHERANKNVTHNNNNNNNNNNSNMYRGVIELNSHTLPHELDTKVPVLLFFTVHNDDKGIQEYNECVYHQVDLANRQREHDKMNEVYQEFGPDAGLAIKLGVVDCRKDPAVLHKYSPYYETFPMIYFMIRNGVCDKLIGVVNESQVKEAIDAFIDYGKEFTETMKNARKGNGNNNNKYGEKMQRHDGDDENAMTLLTAAAERLRKNEVNKASQLYQKALDYSLEEIKVINEKYGVMQKKITPELWRKLVKEGCYSSAPVALCGLAMCALATNHRKEAKEHVERIRKEFPLATSEIRDVATAVVRVELIFLTDYVAERDSYTSLLRKFSSTEQDAVAFYKHELKLCTAAFIERHYNVAIETCIKLIRAEPKILKELKAGNVVANDLVLGPNAITPARQVIMKLFEGIGKNNQKVIQGRKILQQYL